MTSHTGPILLDTSALVHLTRGDAIGLRMAEEHQLRERTEKPLVSIVTVGELLAFAKRNTWGKAKTDKLIHLLREVVVVDLHTQAVLDKYAELTVFLERTGQRIQQNDVWIAATAAVTGALILTMDRDFDRLHPAHVQRAWYDPKGNE